MNGPCYDKSRKALADNLNTLVEQGRGSVNAEAKARKIPQRSLENLTELEVDPRLSTIARVSGGFGLEPWQVLCPIPEHDLRAAALEWLRLYSTASEAVRNTLDIALELAKRTAAQGTGGSKSGDAT